MYIPGTLRYCHVWKLKSDILSQIEMRFSMLQHFDCANQLKMHISFFKLKILNFLSEMMA